MNFNFEVNTLIPYQITKFNSDLRIIHPRSQADGEVANQLNRDQRQRLGVVIDKIGEASCKAQGLKEIITSCRKLAVNDNHRIYLMKDPSENGGKGSVVGLLKVGEKHLFVYDTFGRNHEMNPLCVLDFYVHESHQRKGYGKALYDTMLSMEGAQPEHIAIDKPSEKSVRFLKKHYSLKNAIPQVNNFVVFQGFFDNRSESEFRQRNERLLNRKFDAYSATSYHKNSDTENYQPTVFNRTGSLDSRYRTRNEARTLTELNDFNHFNRGADKPSHFGTPLAANTLNSRGSQQGLNAKPYPQSANSLSNHSESSSSIGSKIDANIQSILGNNKQNEYMIRQQRQQQQQQNSPLQPYQQTNNRIGSSDVLKQQQQQQKASGIQDLFQNFHRYDPFPSLNHRTPLDSKPPLPPPAAPNGFMKEAAVSSVRRATTDLNPYGFNNDRFQQISRTVTNMYDPFPSLATVKTTSELYANQAYMNSKFRKTKLW